MTRASKPKSRDDFHIAILAALELESDAILEMFDGDPWKAAEYKKHGQDRNTYDLGCISGHNVVVAHIGGMGPKHAQNVADSLRLSFRNIRLALIVGVCGGVPITTQDTGDILLGDTIISTHVVDLTFGRQNDDRIVIKKEVNDILGRAPIEVRNFLHKLKTKRCRARLREESFEHLKELCANNDFESSKYPGLEKDIAFPRTYRHKHQFPESCPTCTKCIEAEATFDEVKANGESKDIIQMADKVLQQMAVCEAAKQASCKELKCDSTKMLRRGEARGSGTAEQKPAIHFGQIGSDSNVVKSGYYRDVVAAEEDIIAFEMEGCGVWDTFPTIVVKGVCDYADSHKRKDWQLYAAASAAASMKALLAEWTPTDDMGE